MAQVELIQRISPPQIIEGTPSEIAERLKGLDDEQRLTLIIPGVEIEEAKPTNADDSSPEKTFRQIFAPSQAGFEQTGMTDEELSDLVEAEVKAYRAERTARERQSK